MLFNIRSSTAKRQEVVILAELLDAERRSLVVIGDRGDHRCQRRADAHSGPPQGLQDAVIVETETLPYNDA